MQPGDREPLFHENLGKPIKFLGVFDTVVGPMDDELYRNIYFRDSVVASGVESVVHLMSLHEMRKEFVLQRFHRGSEGNSSALVREIWVPGVHSDIGGGYEENFISNICLLTMSEMLSQYADIALDPSGYRGILQQIQAKIGAYRIVVNKEPSIPNKESRKGDVHKGDELHPLHRYLVDKHIVWKHSTNTEKYYDEYADIGYKIDKKIAKHFEKWID
ncbi:hypothetical protein MEA186_29372 [Mesorhizobium amorphae CCNWGS0123]|uniref:T6SS Phospholipase effector Tle1-like catalytic domain-containing protein n=1 Tax=Mesorhizobium amorphae CCNWGS0123 TaxID=1082933 RepID=G6YIP9_9HYPH|nr:hypothetical protein A6B35_15125 [Mesorhizobium amorphae CCNWGS0123]EHH05854.1 hypothetical protein MEA186_29372 [Mesorhizobium amorphae CCNWGS0123]